MARYIDADLLIETMQTRYDEICDAYGYHDLYASGYDDAIDAVENATTADVAPRAEWISVEERLPKPFVSVLVYMPGENPLPTVHEGFVNKRGAWYAGGFDRLPDEVVAWTDMPEPPEGV